jgi:hypothetical protein
MWAGEWVQSCGIIVIHGDSTLFPADNGDKIISPISAPVWWEKRQNSTLVGLNYTCTWDLQIIWRCIKVKPTACWIVSYSGMLRSIGWLSTDVSGRPIGPIFKGNLDNWLLKMGQIGSPEMLVLNQTTLRNIPEDYRIRVIRSKSPRSAGCVVVLCNHSLVGWCRDQRVTFCLLTASNNHFASGAEGRELRSSKKLHRLEGEIEGRCFMWHF